MIRRLIVIGIALFLVIPVSGCGGGRLGNKLKEAAAERAEDRIQGNLELVSFEDATGAQILFRDNFEDGDLSGWQTTAPWRVVQQSGESNVLVASGSGDAAWVPEGAKWTDYYVRAGIKLQSGGVGLAFRISREGGYWLSYGQGGLFLIKEYPKGNYLPLTQTAAPTLAAWHILTIGGYGGHLQVYVDRELQMDYVDDSPLTHGTIAIAAVEEGAVWVDNVLAVKLTEGLPAPAAAAQLPPTVAPQSGAALQESWEELDEWVPEEGAFPVVQPTPVMGDESASSAEEGWVGEEEWLEGDWPEEQQFEQSEEPLGVEESGELPVIDYFYAEPVEGEPGCYYLHWDLHGADTATLNAQGITAPGSGQTCEAGTYTLVAQNAQGSVEETVTISAEGEVSVPQQLPDLFIGDVLTTIPDPANPREVQVEIRVRNGGPADAGPFTIRWYPHPDREIVGCSIDVPALELHATNWWRCTYAYPQFGTMHWRAVVDEENEILELDDDNNVRTGTVEIARGPSADAPSGAQPDLVILNARFEPSPVIKGQPFRAVMTVKNNGAAAQNTPFSALWHFHGDLGLEDCVWNFSGIGQGAGREVSCTRTTNANAGQAPTWVTVDTDNVIPESEEENNDVSVTMAVAMQSEDHPDPSPAKPDLVILNARFEPSPVIKGQPFRAVMTVKNNGAAAQNTPFSALWHFHDDLGLEDCVWNFSGIGQGAGGEVSCTRTTNANAGQAPTWVTVDTDNVIPESAEENNDVSVTMAVAMQSEDHPDPSPAKPDLLIENAHFEPVHPVPDENFTAVMTVRNSSGVDVNVPFEAMWIFPQALGVDNCVWTFDNGLHAGQAKTVQCTRRSHALPGQSATSPTVDAQNVIDEEDEVNNDVAVTLILYAQDHPDPVAGGKPDLVIGNLQVSPNPVKPTGSLSIRFTVVNQSAAAAGPSQAEWRSQDAGLSFTCAVPQLAGGASHTCDGVMSILPGVGSYHSQAIADVEKTVAETDEQNNNMKQPFNIQP